LFELGHELDVQRREETKMKRKNSWTLLVSKLRIGEAFDDIMLSTILIRVNSKPVTRTINVKGCKHIRGIGLAPLRGSQVLEILDMEDSFLTKNRLGLRFANFANHVSL
jgi:hypothetical protein